MSLRNRVRKDIEQKQYALPSLSDHAYEKNQRVSTVVMNALKSYVPIFKWIPSYNLRQHFIGDLIAGFTVGLMVIPQGLAYATVANVPPQYGLYAAMMGAFLYSILGTCKDVNVGPTAILALLTAEGTSKFGTTTAERLPYALLLSFFAGIIQIVSGFLKLGFLLDFVSHPVISGFTSASAITIAVTQLKSLTGMPVRSEFYNAIYDIFANCKQISWRDTCLGFFCIIVIYSMSQLRRYKRENNWAIWALCISRNAIVAVGTTLFAYIYETQHGSLPFAVVGDVKSGLPSPNGSFLDVINLDMLTSAIPSACFIAVIGLLESIAVGRAFARQNGYLDAHRPSQEMIATGTCQALGCFFGAFPIGGSFSRTAVTSEAGACTPLASTFVAIVLIPALLFFTQALKYIPTAALAAIIICAVLSMIDIKTIKELYHGGRFGSAAWFDLVCLTVCIWACLFISIEWGLAISIVLSLLTVLYEDASAKILVILPYLENKRILWRENSKEGNSFNEYSNESLIVDQELKTLTSYVTTLREHVLTVRIDGNLRFFTSKHILAEVDAIEKNHFMDLDEISLPSNTILDVNKSDPQIETPPPLVSATTPETSEHQFIAHTEHLLERKELRDSDNDCEIAIDNTSSNYVEKVAASVDQNGTSIGTNLSIYREPTEEVLDVESISPIIPKSSKLKGIILDFTRVTIIDNTGAVALSHWIKDKFKRSQPVAIHLVGLNASLRIFLFTSFTDNRTFSHPVNKHFHGTLEEALLVLERETFILPLHWGRRRSQSFP